jgi:hypothetical protein
MEIRGIRMQRKSEFNQKSPRKFKVKDHIKIILPDLWQAVWQ